MRKLPFMGLGESGHQIRHFKKIMRLPRQYTDQELADLGIKLRIDALDLRLVDKKKYRKPWKVIVYNIWRQFGVDYFDGKYKKSLGYPNRFTWTKDVQEQFEKLFETELNQLSDGKSMLPFYIEFYPQVIDPVEVDRADHGVYS